MVYMEISWLQESGSSDTCSLVGSTEISHFARGRILSRTMVPGCQGFLGIETLDLCDLRVIPFSYILQTAIVKPRIYHGMLTRSFDFHL